jgi:protocatechuate 3,4-dioxygenase, alpha subunit
MAETLTGSQTVGPFYHYGLIHEDLRRIAVRGAANEEVSIVGRVLDGAGEAAPDFLLEFWHPSSGFARVAPGKDGGYAASLPRPQADGPASAPHFAVAVFGRGLLVQLHTRCYLPGEPALAGDAVLAQVEAERRSTLIGRAEGAAIRFDILLQGEGETVFFAL